MGAVGYLVKLSQFPPMGRVANRIANTFNFSPHSGQQHPGRRCIGWRLVYEGDEGVHFGGISSEGQPNDDTRIIRASPEDAGFGMYLYWTGFRGIALVTAGKISPFLTAHLGNCYKSSLFEGDIK